MSLISFISKVAVACLCIATTAAASGVGSVQARPKYTIFTGSLKNTNTRIGEDIQRACSHLDIQIIPTQGSFDNITQLVQPPVLLTGYRFAFVQNDTMAYAFKGRGLAGLVQTVAPLYHDDVYLLVNKRSNIRSLKDLKGKRISIGVPGAGVWHTAHRIDTLINARWLSVERPTEESIIAVLAGNIDGVVIVGGAPIPILTELGTVVKQYAELLPLNDKRLDTEYQSATISAGTYPWLEQHIIIRNVQSSIIAAGDVPKPAVDSLLTCVQSNQKTLQQWGHPKWAEVTLNK